jgi:hypothetical protein
MSWLSDYLKRGIKFKITLPWFGEKNLGSPKEPKPIDKQDTLDMIDRMNKKQGGKKCG